MTAENKNLYHLSYESIKLTCVFGQVAFFPLQSDIKDYVGNNLAISSGTGIPPTFVPNQRGSVLFNHGLYQLELKLLYIHQRHFLQHIPYVCG